MRFSLPHGPRVIHPLAFGLFPIFSLLSVNLVWAAFNEALLPAAAVAAITTMGWLLLSPLLPDRHQRGLVISLCWLPFYGYGFLVDTARAAFRFHDMLGPVQLGALVAVLGAVGVGPLWMLRRSRRNFAPWTRALNQVALILLTVALLSCLYAVLHRPAGGTAPADIAIHIGEDERAALPSVYFILCDAYPRADYLRDYFDFDNTPFLEQLRERGFFVADRSRSNYGHTLPSLASTLNLDYLAPDLVPRNFSENYPRLVPLLRDNLVARTLSAHDYELVAIASGLVPTRMEKADRYIRPGVFNNTEYQQALIDMTPVRSLMNRLDQLLWYQLAPFTLNTLAELRRGDRPMFVFAHLLAPHLPHAYDEHGNFVTPFPPYREGWRTVTKFLNRRLIEVVDAIVAREPDAIILILGDHGANTSLQSEAEKAADPWEGDWEDYVRDRSANLSACRAPGLPKGRLYPEITSVNLFRVLFDHYLKTNYGRLEDASWFTRLGERELLKIDTVY